MGRTNFIKLLCEITKLVNASNSQEQLIFDVTQYCLSTLKADKIEIYSCDCKNHTVIKKELTTLDAGEHDSSLLVSNERVTILQHRPTNPPASNFIKVCVPIIWNHKKYGYIDAHYSSQSSISYGDERLFVIIASLLAPKFVEFNKPKRVFKNDNRYYRELVRLLEEEKLYTNENLSLGCIAKRMNLSNSYLSLIINNLSEKNFTTLIHEYRLREVVSAFKAGKHFQYSILAIAYDVGFSSKSTFNAVFKNQYGCSPTEYIRKYV